MLVRDGENACAGGLTAGLHVHGSLWSRQGRQHRSTYGAHHTNVATTLLGAIADCRYRAAIAHGAGGRGFYKAMHEK